MERCMGCRLLHFRHVLFLVYPLEMWLLAQQSKHIAFSFRNAFLSSTAFLMKSWQLSRSWDPLQRGHDLASTFRWPCNRLKAGAWSWKVYQHAWQNWCSLAWLSSTFCYYLYLCWTLSFLWFSIGHPFRRSGHWWTQLPIQRIRLDL